MSGIVPPVPDERTGPLAYLAHTRYILRLTAYGLTDEQARATPTVSGLSIGGLIKHVAATEDGWMDTVLQLEQSSVEQGVAEYTENFRMQPDDTLDDVLATYQRIAERTAEVLAGVADLGQPVPVPQRVPWFPDDVDAWSVRWVLLGLIQETARHAGHADQVREAVDGGTAFPIMAAAEGWPATAWLQPWEPARPDGAIRSAAVSGSERVPGRAGAGPTSAAARHQRPARRPRCRCSCPARRRPGRVRPAGRPRRPGRQQ